MNAAKALRYNNAGTVEFIYDDKTGEFYFLEVNTRLQVEHPVAEEITGLDLVRMQIESAQGMLLRVKQKDIQEKGYAIQCRLYAEGATNDFMPMTGTVERFASPDMEGLRVESAIESGSAITVHYDPMIAKLGGDVFAGGFLFLAGSTYVVAAEGLRFGLPEVKRGLFPYQVMAALLKVMPARTVIDWCIRGYDLPVERAMELGLVTHCVKRDDLDNAVQNLLDELLVNSPTAIRIGLEAFDHIRPKEAEHAYLLQMLQKTIGTKDGMEGLTAFREKRAPNWTGE